MGVGMRLSPGTSACVPFWAVALFCLIAGPFVVAGWLLYWLIRGTVALVKVIAA